MHQKKCEEQNFGTKNKKGSLYILHTESGMPVTGLRGGAILARLVGLMGRMPAGIVAELLSG